MTSGRVARLEIKTADELGGLHSPERRAERRAARETALMGTIYRLFVARGGPIPVADVRTAVGDGRTYATDRALAMFDEDDVIRLRDGVIDIAYPFASKPTPFAVRLAGGAERYACCAMDALGMAPMLGQRIEIRSRCHHGGEALAFDATPHGASADAAALMVWFGRRGPEDRGKVADGL